MSQSTIKAPKIIPIIGSYVGNTGASTFQLPAVNYRTYLLSTGKIVIALLCQGPETLLTNASDIEITANGNYNFTIRGIAWYMTPCMIPANGF